MSDSGEMMITKTWGELEVMLAEVAGRVFDEKLPGAIKAAVSEDRNLIPLIEAAVVLGSTPAALRKAVNRGAIIPDSYASGGGGRGKTHKFRRSTLDAYSNGARANVDN